MKCAKTLFCVVIVLTMLLSHSRASTSENYVLERSSLSGVGFEASSENYLLRGTLGQEAPVGSSSSESYDLWAGFYRYFQEILLLLGDLDGDDDVDLNDLSIFVSKWCESSCDTKDWCEGADLDQSTTVNFADYAKLAENCLEGVEQYICLYDVSLDSDPGWPTEGEWAFGAPAGEGGVSYGNPDPDSGCTGNKVYGVNLNGDYSTAVGGPYYLTAGPFDCGGYSNVNLKFARWLNTDAPTYVESKIEASNNGTSWSDVWEHTGGAAIADENWQTLEYDISSIADNQDTVYIRCSYQILDDRAYPYSGWNIDDIQLWGTQL